MKNKIKRLSKGDFSYSTAGDYFPGDADASCVSEKARCTKGSFSLRVREGGQCKWTGYPSSFGYAVREQGFDGNPVNISYTYDGSVWFRDMEHGKFTIVCNGGSMRWHLLPLLKSRL